jgi:predicted transcriptional regulator
MEMSMNIFLVIVCIIVCVGLYVINESVQGGIQRNLDVTDKIDELIKVINRNRTESSAEETVRHYLHNMDKNLDSIEAGMANIDKRGVFIKDWNG